MLTLTLLKVAVAHLFVQAGSRQEIMPETNAIDPRNCFIPLEGIRIIFLDIMRIVLGREVVLHPGTINSRWDSAWRAGGQHVQRFVDLLPQPKRFAFVTDFKRTEHPPAAFTPEKKRGKPSSVLRAYLRRAVVPQTPGGPSTADSFTLFATFLVTRLKEIAISNGVTLQDVHTDMFMAAFMRYGEEVTSRSSQYAGFDALLTASLSYLGDELLKTERV